MLAIFYLIVLVPVVEHHDIYTVNVLWTVGETVEVGNFDPKIATFWIDLGNRLFGEYNLILLSCTLS